MQRIKENTRTLKAEDVHWPLGMTVLQPMSFAVVSKHFSFLFFFNFLKHFSNYKEIHLNN